MLIPQMMRVLPNPVPSAYPSSRSTFGLGVMRKSESGPLIGVMSATKTSHWSILSNRADVMSGQPATPSVS